MNKCFLCYFSGKCETQREFLKLKRVKLYVHECQDFVRLTSLPKTVYGENKCSSPS
jgi:hypothetical protein